jgi:pyridoxal phosphate enzyme (YggS family)
MPAKEGACLAKNSPLAEKLSGIKSRIAAAAVKAGRDPAEVTLIAVTKTAAPEQIREIIRLGVGDLGESRVQVVTQKVAQITEFYQRQKKSGDDDLLPTRLRWHMIGHLQRNKVKAILPLIDLVHSLDSLRLAEEIEVAAGKLAKKTPVLLQVNASEEKSKFGVAVGASVHLAEQIASMSNLVLVGLMTMAPLGADLLEAKAVFTRTREIFEECKWHKIGGSQFKHLSMGMSNDFETAIAEGATMVRIGTALFGNGAGATDEHSE